MTQYVAFLRAVNLPSHGKVSMEALREFVSGLGYSHVRTLLNSGNVTFEAEAITAGELEALLEREAAERLNLQTDFLVRSVDELGEILARNPFPDMAERDPGHLVVMFLKSAPESAAVTALQAAIAGREVVRAGEQHLYITYPDGIGRSKLTNAAIESKLRTRGTGRNWNTVAKLGKR